MGDTVTLTVNPDEGYLLEDVWIRDDDYNSLKVMGGMWYSGNEAKFVMPMSDVSVYVSFNTPEEGEFGIQIPQKDTLRLTLPEKMSWVYVFVEADEQGNYYDNSDGVLELTASEGLILDVNGNNQAADEGDFLAIYDGIGEGAESIQIPAEGIFEKASTGNSLTFRFKSDESGNGRGPDLYVSVLKTMPEPSAIMIYEFADGSKSAVIDGAYSGTDAVNIEEDIEVDGVEFNREFSTAEDGYSTLMLPFDVYTNNTWGMQTVLAFNDVIDSIVDGVKKKFVVMQALWDADTSSQNIELKANTPYLVKMRSSQLSIYGSVTLRKTENTVLTLGDWQVHGTTAYKKWQTGDPELGSVYGFAANAKDSVKVGQFVKAGSGAYIKPFRAYLLHNASNPEPRPAPAGHVSVWRNDELPEEIDIVVIDGNRRAGIAGSDSQPDDGRTVIGTINTRTGEIKFKSTYDLKGRPVSGTPKAKGMYIKGKK